MTPAIFSSEDALKRQTQQALDHALAFDGQIFPLPLPDEASTTGALALLANTVLGANDSFYTPSADFAEYISRTGATLNPPELAGYHFYEVLPDPPHIIFNLPRYDTLSQLERTVFIGTKFRTGTALVVTSGDQPEAQLRLADVPLWMWAQRELLLQAKARLSLVFVDTRLIAGVSPNAAIKPLDS